MPHLKIKIGNTTYREEICADDEEGCEDEPYNKDLAINRICTISQNGFWIYTPPGFAITRPTK